jgi:type I restriction enzyme S subunit
VSWSKIQLSSLCHKITDGSHNPSQGINKSEYLMLSSKNIFHDDINFKDPRYLTKEDFEQENKRTDVVEDDILLTIVGTIGRVAVVSNNTPKFTLQRSVAVLKPKSKLIKPRFLMYSLRNMSDLLASESRGVAQKGIYLKQIRELEIPLPPLAEQQKIASILDAADSLRQKDQQLIEKYTALSQSLFLEMFGDPVSNPMGWERKNLQNLVKTVIDCPHTTPKWTSSGKVAIRTSNLTQGGWSWKDKRFVSEEDFHDRSKRGYVKSGDIILSREGTIGVLAIVDKEMEICLGQRLVQLIPDFSLANNYYLLHLLLYELEPERISRVMVGATSKHLNVKELREMNLPVPPINLQNQFAERIQSIEAQKLLALASLEKSAALFNSLLQRAFKGELTT